VDVDTAVAMVLGVLFLALCLGGLVWLDTGPVGRHGRDVRRSVEEPDADESADETADEESAADR
jgi:hypothetical protein